MTEHGLRREDARVLVQDGPEVFVGRAETLHQKVALALVYHRDSLRDGLCLDRVVLNREFCHIDAVLFADSLDKSLVTDESRIDEPEIHCL